jgi:proteasome accessory factor C
MSTSAEQMARLLAMVPYLQRRGEVSVAEAAKRFDVPERTIQRDLQVLMFCGLPGQLPGEVIDFDFEALEDRSVIRIRDADFLPRPLRLGSREGAALLAALSALREGGDPEVQQVVDRTLAKVRSAVGEGAAIQVTPSVAATERDLAARLEDAVAQGRQVRLSHAAAVRDEVRSRTVDPIAVSESQGHLYLDGWDHESGEQRLFRLDRVVDAEILDSAAQVRAAPLDLSRGAFRPTSSTPTARVRVGPSARWVTEYYPVEEVHEVTEGDFAGGLEIVVPVAHPRWLVGLMLRLGPEGRLVEPADLDDLVRATAGSALAGYDTSGA